MSNELLYPFNDITFNENTSILLDASFLLALVYEDDPKHTNCISLLRQLLTSKCKLYITTSVSSEVLNQLIIKMFISDMRYKIDRTKPFNSVINISDIFYTFSRHDRKIIREKRISKLTYIPYRKYFNNIYKSSNKRSLLSIYFKTAIVMHAQLEDTLKVEYVFINEETIKKSRELMAKDLLSVNDALHLGAAIQYNIPYLLTLDSDFNHVKDNPAIILKV